MQIDFYQASRVGAGRNDSLKTQIKLQRISDLVKPLWFLLACSGNKDRYQHGK